MHILIFPSEDYIPKHLPRSNIFIHDQAKILHAKGIKVGVISLTFQHSFLSLIKIILSLKSKHTQKITPFEAFKLLIQKTLLPKNKFITHEVVDGVNVMRYDGFWGMINSKKPLNHYKLWLNQGEFAINSYIKKYGKPTLIHAHNMMYAGLSAFNFQKKYNIPFVVTEHSSSYTNGKIPDVLHSKLSTVFQHCSSIYAVSPQFIELLENKFLKNHSNRIGWLPNVLDSEFEKLEIPTNKNEDNRKVRFLNVANLIPLKGQEDLINAFDKTFKDIENVELLVVGGGYLKESLNQLIQELNLSHKVKMIGLLSRKEILNLLDNSDVFVLPSHSETFGVVLIEALSRGMPIISTTCGGPECIVDDENGVLVEVKNINQLADALQKMYKNHSNYDKKSLRREVIKKYGNETFYEKIMDVYKEAIIYL